MRDLVVQLSRQQQGNRSNGSATKKKRDFLLLQDLHGRTDATKSTDDEKTPNEKLQAAAADLKRRIAQAKCITKEPRAFGIAPELVLENLVMRINLRMDPEAIAAGNTLKTEMFQAVHIQDTSPDAAYIDCF